MYTILFTTPEYHNLLPVVCTLIEVSGVQWMESSTCDRASLSEPSQVTKNAQRYSLGERLTAVMMIDMNGPDIGIWN